jgi:hypothetical protein
MISKYVGFTIYNTSGVTVNTSGTIKYVRKRKVWHSASNSFRDESDTLTTITLGSSITNGSLLDTTLIDMSEWTELEIYVTLTPASTSTGVVIIYQNPSPDNGTTTVRQATGFPVGTFQFNGTGAITNRFPVS